MMVQSIDVLDVDVLEVEFIDGDFDLFIRDRLVLTPEEELDLIFVVHSERRASMYAIESIRGLLRHWYYPFQEAHQCDVPSLPSYLLFPKSGYFCVLSQPLGVTHRACSTRSDDRG